MSATSFNQIFRTQRLHRDAVAIASLGSMRFHRAIERDELVGKAKSGRANGGGGGGRGTLSHKLAERLGGPRRFGFSDGVGVGAYAFDPRQRAIVKIHYFGHGGGGGGALQAHARYVAREAAALGQGSEQALDAEPGADAKEAQARAHTSYLARGGAAEASLFYDAGGEGVDGAGKAAAWAKADRRHFRIILAPENGAAIGDLNSYTREVMQRAEAALGTRLEWVAVNHWDTDNPHTHIILRGKTRDGRDLVIPREFVKHGFREAARDVATDRLGNRTRDDERRALDRETRAHRPTRLDGMIAGQIGPDGRVRVADLAAANGDPNVTNALKERARELERLGLASELKRNVLSFQSDWRERLGAMEMHLDIRKRLVNQRTVERGAEAQARQTGLRSLLQR
jgi:type IV secretory pathway VirD2 relaxase